MKPSDGDQGVSFTEGAWFPLAEATIADDGLIPVCLIKAGESKNGRWYGEDVLRKAAGVYHKGLHNLWNHPSEAEIRAHPSGDLNAIASILAENAHFDPIGPINPKTGEPNGAGLYSKLKPLSAYRQRILELGDTIGLSHRVRGRSRPGVVNGKKLQIVEEIFDPRVRRGIPAVTVDWVARPAAGGGPLFSEEEETMPDTHEITLDEAVVEIGSLTEQVGTLTAENADLTEQIATRDATIAEHQTTIATFRANEIFAEAVGKAELDEVVIGRVRSLVEAHAVPMTEAGVIDEDQYRAMVETVIADEAKYAAEIAEAHRQTGTGVRGGTGSAGAVNEFLERSGGIRGRRGR